MKYIQTLFCTTIIGVLSFMASTGAWAYTEDDGIIFKGQWLKRYILIPENYEVEDGKRIVVKNDDMVLKVNRDGMITKLILDVHNNTDKTISIPINRMYLRIGDNVYPFKSKGENTSNDNAWKINKMKRKSKRVRRYVETKTAVPINISEPTETEILIPYKVGDENKSLSLKFKLVPYSGEDEADSEK